MGKKSKKRCPYCNRLYAPSYLNTHIRRVHKREPPKLGAHRGKVKGRPNSYVQRDAPLQEVDRDHAAGSPRRHGQGVEDQAEEARQRQQRRLQ